MSKKKKNTPKKLKPTCNNYSLLKYRLDKYPEEYRDLSEWVAVENTLKSTSKNALACITDAIEMVRKHTDLSITQPKVIPSQFDMLCFYMLAHALSLDGGVSFVKKDYDALEKSACGFIKDYVNVLEHTQERAQNLQEAYNEILHDDRLFFVSLCREADDNSPREYAVAFAVYACYILGLIPTAIWIRITYWVLLEVFTHFSYIHEFKYKLSLIDTLNDSLSDIRKMNFSQEIRDACLRGTFSSFSADGTAIKAFFILGYIESYVDEQQAQYLINRLCNSDIDRYIFTDSKGTALYLPDLAFMLKMHELNKLNPKWSPKKRLLRMLYNIYSKDKSLSDYKFTVKDFPNSYLTQKIKLREWGDIIIEYPTEATRCALYTAFKAKQEAGILRVLQQTFYNECAVYTKINKLSDKITRLEADLAKKPNVVKSKPVVLDDKLVAENKELKSKIAELEAKVLNLKNSRSKLESRIKTLEDKETEIAGTVISDEDLSFYHALEERVYELDNEPTDDISFSDEEKQLMLNCRATVIVPTDLNFDLVKSYYPNAKFKAVKFGTYKVSVSPNPDGVVFCAVQSPHGATYNIKSQLGEYKYQLFVSLSSGQLSLARCILEHYKQLRGIE